MGIKFKTKEQSRLETLAVRLSGAHTPEQDKAFASVQANCTAYMEQVKAGLDTPLTVEDFKRAARQKTSAELKAWALENGIPAAVISEAAGNLLAFLADANRYGYSWDDLFHD